MSTDPRLSGEESEDSEDSASFGSSSLLQDRVYLRDLDWEYRTPRGDLDHRSDSPRSSAIRRRSKFGDSDVDEDGMNVGPGQHIGKIDFSLDGNKKLYKKNFPLKIVVKAGFSSEILFTTTITEDEIGLGGYVQKSDHLTYLVRDPIDARYRKNFFQLAKECTRQTAARVKEKWLTILCKRLKDDVKLSENLAKSTKKTRPEASPIFFDEYSSLAKNGVFGAGKVEDKNNSNINSTSDKVGGAADDVEENSVKGGSGGTRKEPDTGRFSDKIVEQKKYCHWIHSETSSGRIRSKIVKKSLHEISRGFGNPESDSEHEGEEQGRVERPRPGPGQLMGHAEEEEVIRIRNGNVDALREAEDEEDVTIVTEMSAEEKVARAEYEFLRNALKMQEGLT